MIHAADVCLKHGASLQGREQSGLTLQIPALNLKKKTLLPPDTPLSMMGFSEERFCR